MVEHQRNLDRIFYLDNAISKPSVFVFKFLIRSSGHFLYGLIRTILDCTDF